MKYLLSLLATVVVAGAVLSGQKEEGSETLALRRIGDGLVDWLAQYGEAYRYASEDGVEPEAPALSEIVVRPGAETELRFVYVPPGRARLGMKEDDRVRLAKETGNLLIARNSVPDTHVRIAVGYFILDREVTVAQFAAFDKKRAAKKGDEPLRDVSWEDAVKFCDWLQKKSGFAIRLPTEVEWEYAARGWKWQQFPWSEEGFFAYAEKGEKGTPRAFESEGKDVSWRGARDMGGNLSEWCLDLYDDGHYRKVTPLKPYFPAAVRTRHAPRDIIAERTYRGGSFRDEKHNCEIPIRRALAQHRASPAVGFRPVLLVQP